MTLPVASNFADPDGDARTYGATGLPPGLSIKAGDKPGHLHLMVGTLDESVKCWVVVESVHSGGKPAFPDGVRPVVEIEFAPQTPGAPPIKKRYQLDKLC